MSFMASCSSLISSMLDYKDVKSEVRPSPTSCSAVRGSVDVSWRPRTMVENMVNMPILFAIETICYFVKLLFKLVKLFVIYCSAGACLYTNNLFIKFTGQLIQSLLTTH